jgi:heat shock protein HslJ
MVWGNVFRTGAACAPSDLEANYLQALLGASRWRTEDGELILDNGTDILRFRLAPP